MYVDNITIVDILLLCYTFVVALIQLQVDGMRSERKRERKRKRKKEREEGMLTQYNITQLLNPKEESQNKIYCCYMCYVIIYIPISEIGTIM